MKSNDLKFSSRCQKKRNMGMNVESNKDDSYIISMIKSETIKYFSKNSREITLFKIRDFAVEKMEAITEESGLKLSRPDEFITVFSKVMYRYLSQEKRFDNIYNFDTYPAEKVIDCFGLSVSVIPDAIFFSKNGVEIVKYKFKKPDMTIGDRERDKSTLKCLELYAMIRYARAVAKEMNLSGDISCSAAYYYLEKKKDDIKNYIFEDAFFSKTASSVIGISENIFNFGGSAEVSDRDYDAIFAPQFADFIHGEDGMNTESCEHCSLKNVCFYQELPTKADLSQIKKKSVKDIILNPAQKAAIEFEKGYARINAVPGAGKTLVTVLRVIRLLEKGVKPEKILMITYTNNGTKEMRERIGVYAKEFNIDVNGDINDISIMTFNAFAYEIVKKEYMHLGFSAPPTVIDEVEKCIIVADLLNSVPHINGLNYYNFDLNMYKAAGACVIVKEIFDIIKKNDISVLTDSTVHTILEECKYSLSNERDEAVRIIKEIFALYPKYKDKCQKENYITYDDQEVLMNEVFKYDEKYLDKMGFEHIFVDEFQDSSEEQMTFIKRLIACKSCKSVMSVGDDAQSIFSFRNTSPKNIINYFKLMNKEEKDFIIRPVSDDEMYDFYLLENHRSVPAITDFANSINMININRVEKDIFSTKKDNGLIPSVMAFNNKDDEKQYIATQVVDDIKNGCRPDNIAVIAATRKELMEIQTLLNLANIKTIMLSPDYVLENDRVKALINLSKAYYNPDINGNYIDYVNILSNGKLLDLNSQDLEKKIEKLQDVMRCIAEVEDDEKISLFKTLAMAITDDDELYEDFVRKVFAKKNFDRIITYLKAFEKYGSNVTYKKVENYVGAVMLTTGHSSKGLEWPNVYISVTGFHKEKFKSKEDEEEKRRLFYVAITRAAEKLTITGKTIAYSEKVTSEDEKGKKKIETIYIPNQFLAEAIMVSEKMQAKKVS